MRVYQSEWTLPNARDDEGKLRLGVLEPTWNLLAGWHPDMDLGSSFYDPAVRKPFEVKKIGTVPDMVEVKPQGAVTGHVMMRDGNTAYLSQPEGRVPIMPLFVRDLAGRVVYTGLTRHKQPEDGPRHIMPAGATLLPDNAEGAHMLEKVYFSPFRFVEMSSEMDGDISGNLGTEAAITYQAPNLYPYKLRMDTFYQEGWRLPQTERVFVKPGVDKATADKAASDLLNLWHKRPKDQTYEAFYEANEQAFDSFFESGCTLMPTLEAFNGNNIVAADFTHEGFWPGKAVQGLHEVVGQKDADSPAGTIIEVLEPGYVTHTDMAKARVIVSNGKGYVSPTDPEDSHKRLYPDLRLPHQRTSGKWGATWLPVKPVDFEEPAIWDWDMEGAGRFAQTRGPLWDPLHYYYECVPEVVKAFQENRTRRNINIVKVPEHALGRFYPVTETRGFDTQNVPLLKERREALSLLPTSIVWHEDVTAQTGIGYHPLPLGFEHELDNWWLPDLAPKYRVSATIPLNVEQSMAKVIHPKISPDKYIATVKGDKDECPWISDPLYLMPATSDDRENYPYLKRYLSPTGVPEAEVREMILPFLQRVDLEDEAIHDLDVETIRRLEENWPGLYQIILTANRKAEEAVKFRHSLFKSDYEKYLKALWEATLMQDLYQKVEDARDPKLKLPSSAVMGLQS